ncbi:MAG: MFS transporter [Spirochaetia bacterium]|jgi:MFS family permease|nr:MFS transporter [Spirochaetia bacterium]
MKKSLPSERRLKSRIERYRSRFLVFNILNSLSFMLLSGNIPTLFALEMGATGTYIGILGSLNFMTYFFMPLGRRAIRNQPIIKIFGWSWMLRYWGMIPALAAPFLAKAGHPALALSLLLGSSLLFNIFRGIGLIGNNPVLGMLAGERERGAFLSNVQIATSMTAIATSAATVMVLGAWSGNILYAALLGAGILTGSIASSILLGLPEPQAYRPPAGASFLKSIKDAWADPRLRRFVSVFAPLSFSAGTARTFIVTHARVLYEQSPGLVMTYLVAFNLGSVTIGYLSRKLMDRLGSKPLYVVFTAVAAIAMIPVAWSPELSTGLRTGLYLAFLNFLVGLGIAGEENAGQTYFFSIVKPEHMMDLAVIYYLVYGLGGALGSAAGGIFLDVLSVAGVAPAMSYRLLYSITFGITLVSALGALKLSSPDSASVLESLGVMFSMRDLKAIGLLERLERSGSPSDEARLIKELGGYGVAVAERELLPYLSSPRLDVRIEALLALENLEQLSNKALRAISLEIVRNPYTTAYAAARILGKRRWTEGLPMLRAALSADDYMLKGAAVVALATMSDEESLPVIEDLLTATDNPRLMIRAASAIERFGRPSSIPALVSVLKQSEPPPYAFDEIVLALAGILGGLNGFYALFSTFTQEKDEAVHTLLDSIDDSASPRGFETRGIPAFRKDLEAFIDDASHGDVIARTISDSTFLDAGPAAILSEAAIDSDLDRHEGFRFFLAACAVEAANTTKIKSKGR